MKGTTMPITATRSTIREHRDTLGITQAQLAERVGCTQCSLSNWETGQAVPRQASLVKLAEVLGVQIYEIAYGGEVIIQERGAVRSILQGLLDSGATNAVWKIDLGILIRPDHRDIRKAMVGHRPAYKDYLLRVSDMTELPIGNHRSLVAVRIIKFATEFPV